MVGNGERLLASANNRLGRGGHKVVRVGRITIRSVDDEALLFTLALAFLLSAWHTKTAVRF